MAQGAVAHGRGTRCAREFEATLQSYLTAVPSKSAPTLSLAFPTHTSLASRGPKGEAGTISLRLRFLPFGEDGSLAEEATRQRMGGPVTGSPPATIMSSPWRVLQVGRWIAGCRTRGIGRSGCLGFQLHMWERWSAPIASWRHALSLQP